MSEQASPLVSIVVTTFNQSRFLHEAINSILAQSYPHFELLICNNASTDETADILATYQDPRIRVFSRELNEGPCPAINTLMKKATGRYLAFFCTDDLYEPQRLEKQVAFLESNSEYGMVLSRAHIIDERGNPFNDSEGFYYKVFDQENRSRAEWLNYFFFQGNCWCFPSTLIRKSVADKVGYHNESYISLHDFDYWIRVTLQAKTHILPERLVRFRVQDKELNTTANNPGNRLRGPIELTQILNHYLTLQGDPEFVMEVFPGLKETLSSSSSPNVVAFALARQATEMSTSPHILFGLTHLYRLMSNPEARLEIERATGFSVGDLLKLSARVDPFGIELRETLVRDNTEYKHVLEVREKAVEKLLGQVTVAWEDNVALRDRIAGLEKTIQMSFSSRLRRILRKTGLPLN